MAVDPLRTMGFGLIAIIPNLIFLAILVLVTRYTLRVIRVLFDGLASGTVTLSGFEADSGAHLPPHPHPCDRVRAHRRLPLIPGSESGAFGGSFAVYGNYFLAGIFITS